MKSFLSTRNISIAMLLLTGLFAVIFIVPNVRMAKEVYDAPTQNPYLSYVRYDELPYQPIETRGMTITEGRKLFDLGMKDYLRKDYASAIKNLKLALQSESQAQWWLYLGVSQFMNHESPQAIATLEKADSLNMPILKTTARWYLAQAYLTGGNVDRAKLLLESIVAAKSERSTAAEKLLAQIGSVVPKKP